jgi:hypothetical protein
LTILILKEKIKQKREQKIFFFFVRSGKKEISSRPESTSTRTKASEKEKNSKKN